MMRGENKMNDRILVTYATLTHSTAEVARAVGQRLRDAGAEVDVYPAQQVADLSPYSAAVVGSGVRWGKPYPEALTFLSEQQQALSKVPVAYFIVCGAMQEDTEENRHQARSYMDTLRASAPHVQPVATELFGGRLDYQKLSLLLRLMMKLMKKQEGDYRNWNAIHAWAEELENVLPGVAVNRDTFEPVRADQTGIPVPEIVRESVPAPG
jgi:menaquinone-dependent protoporphyrinogen oxidase